MSLHPFRSVPTSLAVLPSDPRAVAAEEFYTHLSAVYSLSQENPHVFASPLGPVSHGEDHAWLPRFVFFGPATTDESWRLAFYAGFCRNDLRASHALLGLVESLARHAEEGHALNLTFLPLVDLAGHLFNAPGRKLGSTHWGRATAPEIAALEKDARRSGYHGFIRVETAPAGDEGASLCMRAPLGTVPTPDVEIVTSADFEPFHVRLERQAEAEAWHGPLSIADDLPVRPFELTLRVPASWPDELYRRAVETILGRFVLKYRAFQAFGGHL